MIVACAMPPPRPASVSLVDACTSKLPAPNEVGARRELQAGVALGERDEVAVGDRRRAVVLEQRAVGDAGDLEVRHLGAVGRVAA